MATKRQAARKRTPAPAAPAVQPGPVAAGPAAPTAPNEQLGLYEVRYRDKRVLRVRAPVKFEGEGEKRKAVADQDAAMDAAPDRFDRTQEEVEATGAELISYPADPDGIEPQPR